MNTLLQATAMSFGERAAYAGKMVLIGMGAVFGSLAILWLALVLFRLLVARDSKKESTPTPPSAKEGTLVAQPTAPEQDGAVVAAITAAVAATLAAENGGVAPAFRVVSFRRVGKQ